MHQIVEQTHEEKVAMYMKNTKRELISMLIERDKNRDLRVPYNYVMAKCEHQKPAIWAGDTTGGGYICCKCGNWIQEQITY